MKKYLCHLIILCCYLAFSSIALGETPLTQPQASNLEIKGFANEAFMAAFSYDFVNYKDEQAKAAHYFTPDAWKTVQKALAEMGLLKKIIDGRLITSSLAAKLGPIIAAQGIRNGRYTWHVLFDATITYQSANDATSSNQKVDMFITRAKDGEGVRGLIVSEIAVKLAQTLDT